MSAMLGLLASALWGCSDFAGGISARHVPLAWVVVANQLVGVVVFGATAVGCALTVGLSIPAIALGWGALAGAAGAVGLATFYRAMATGTMGIVAPVTAGGVVVPVVVSIAQGERPSGLQLAGMAVAAVGIVLATGPELRAEAGEGRRMPVVLAGASALLFGFVALALARGAHHALLPTLVAQRTTGMTLSGSYLLIRRVRYVGGRRRVWQLLGVGLGDGGANLAYAAATRDGLVSVAAVLSSLYPVISSLLAWRYEGERMQRLQVGGVLFALIGVVLLASS